jgi:HTH-type transcriptional regulator / antitoxin HipB
MVIRTSADLGAAIRSCRRALGLAQSDLAERVGVQRQWVVKIEGGKSTAEVGLVLRALAVLELELDLRQVARLPTALQAPKGISYAVDAALDRTRTPLSPGRRGRRPPGKRQPR